MANGDEWWEMNGGVGRDGGGRDGWGKGWMGEGMDGGRDGCRK